MPDAGTLRERFPNWILMRTLEFRRPFSGSSVHLIGSCLWFASLVCLFDSSPRFAHLAWALLTYLCGLSLLGYTCYSCRLWCSPESAPDSGVLRATATAQLLTDKMPAESGHPSTMMFSYLLSCCEIHCLLQKEHKSGWLYTVWHWGCGSQMNCQHLQKLIKMFCLKFELFGRERSFGYFQACATFCSLTETPSIGSLAPISFEKLNRFDDFKQIPCLGFITKWWIEETRAVFSRSTLYNSAYSKVFSAFFKLFFAIFLGRKDHPNQASQSMI